jgi:broad specificity phosphatase PhoE
MKRTLILVIALLIVAPAVAAAQKLVIVVRHAERADGGSMSPNAQPDPALSASGETRARKLAAMLGESGIAAIYTTEFRRTKDTAAPLAEKLRLVPVVIKADDTNAMIESIKTTRSSNIVLIVGHSDTIPKIVKAFGGPEITVADGDYDNIFFVVPASGTLTKIKF